MEIQIHDSTYATECVVCRNDTGMPNSDGVLARHRLAVPAFASGVCWAKDATMGEPLMLGNATLPYVFRTFDALPRGSVFALIQLASGGYLALLPLSGPLTVSWLGGTRTGLLAECATLGTERVAGDIPVVAWSVADDPYRACHQVWQKALSAEEIQATGRMRSRKQYPTVFEYLGWCSWEHLKSGISETVLLQALDDIERSEVPVRWMLVDDGHLRLDEQGRLTSFVPNDKFPRGWGPLIARRSDTKVSWFGIWWTASGRNTVSPTNDLGALNDHLRPVEKGLVPRSTPADNRAFYRALFGAAARAGFDFVKLDFQTHHFRYYWGSENAAASARLSYRAIEAAAKTSGVELMNCICQNHARLFTFSGSATGRNTKDYRVGDFTKALVQLHQAFHNPLWLGQTVWNDQDMFHSRDAVSGKVMSVAKALSAGPIYLSDDPREFHADHIHPLCFSDGRLLRPLAPGVASRQSLFCDPRLCARPYIVVAPLPNRAAAVAAFNLNESRISVRGTITAEDYGSAGGMMQPYEGAWDEPEEGLLLYDWDAQSAVVLGDGRDLELPDYSACLFLLCPIVNGWAVIGRSDKYLSPAGVEVLSCEPDTLELVMLEPGPLTIWSNSGVAVEDLGFSSAGGGLFTTSATGDSVRSTIRITRRTGHEINGIEDTGAAR